MMADHDARDLSRRLAEQAEAVCRHYLSAGRRHGNYWLVGDVRNTPGRSLYVRLRGPSEGRGAAGRWTDASTGEFGDLLDLIREALGLADFRDVADKARSFLALPHPAPDYVADRLRTIPSYRPEMGRTSTDAARRLWDASRPLSGVADVYLRSRDLTRRSGLAALRFHPDCYYRADADSPTAAWPALIAVVTDLEGRVTGVHRTWLARDGKGKAPVAIPRRAMGDLLGNAVRFGAPVDVLAAGEGIETVISLREIMPDLPLAACLSSAHLAAMAFPSTLRRVYVLRDDDPVGSTHHGLCRMADLAEVRLHLDRLAATAFLNFLPLTAAPSFLAGQESSGPAVLRCAVAPAGCSAARLRLVDRHRGHGGRGPITAWRYDNG